ncbi:MAG: hypothetical protein HUU35_20455 [Armatimonadetes bacterium]|nr:hypothetical protein [Armatimonadota bacterium]
MRQATRWLAVGLLSLAAFFPGCGSGLTGGSIPPGGTRAEGIVVRGDAPGVVLPGAVIRFQPISSSRAASNGGTNPPPPPTFPDNGGGNGGGGTTPLPVPEVPGTVKVTTTEQGTFAATSLPNGPLRVIVSPPADSGLLTISYELDPGEGADYYIVAAPLPAGFSTAGFTGLEVGPTNLDLRVGEAAQLEVRLVGAAPPAIVPSYLLKGGMGLINVHGRFTAVRPGRGVLRVLAGPYYADINVVVREAR